MKNIEHHVVIRELKLKPQYDATTYIFKWLREKLLVIPKASEIAEPLYLSSIAGENTK